MFYKYQYCPQYLVDLRPIRNYEYVGSLLFGTRLELHNTLHLTMALIKSKLFPKKKTSTK